MIWINIQWENELELRDTIPIGHPETIPNPILFKLHHVLSICLGLGEFDANVWVF
jgi:hypothetical protein